MRLKGRANVVVTTVVMLMVPVALLAGIVQTPTQAQETATQATTGSVVVSASNDATEGAWFEVTATLTKPKKAVSGRRVVKARVRTDQAKEARFRAVVTYKGTTRCVASRPVRVSYWPGKDSARPTTAQAPRSTTSASRWLARTGTAGG